MGKESYCAVHMAEYRKKKQAKMVTYDHQRGSKHQRGYNARWDRLSKLFRKNNPFCAICEKNGILKIGQCVDHIIPHKDDKELFWDSDNLQTLCFSCHGIKTAGEDGGFNNKIKE